MAVYCISDIHGKLEAFKYMLEHIEFKYDGSDTLYILGDMVDWDERSIETLLFCKKLQEENSFVHVIIGNHEDMFKKDIKKYTVSGMNYLLKQGHFKLNKQEETIRDFISLEEEQRADITRWLNKLAYFSNIVVGDNKFYISHSNVLNRAKDRESLNYKDVYERMVWERVKLGDNPIRRVNSDTETILVHGHTIVSEYKSYDSNGKLQIFKDLDNQRIALDCGAKVLGIRKMARLACIRLDDFEEFYVWKYRDEYILE